jgi:hypothetical protein
MSIRRGYSGRHGGVPFPHASQHRSLLSQCLTWGCTRGGGCLPLTVAGMAPRRPSITTWPCKVTGKHFEGVAGPPSRARRVSRTGVGGAASRGQHRPRRTVPHSGGDGFPPRELVRQNRGVSPRRMMAPPRRCQSIKCPYPRAGTGVCVRGALERGGACSGGGVDPRARRSPLEVSVHPRAGRSPL